jgi:hypothetical protein
MSKFHYQTWWPVTWRRHVLSAALLASAAGLTPPFAPVSLAQSIPVQAPAAEQLTADGASYTVAYDITLKLNADRTAEYVETRRVKVLGIAAVQQVSQQSLDYAEGMQSFEFVAAYTEKADGRKEPVDPAAVVIRDGATGITATYLLDLKIATVIFPDVAVGDTLVMTTRRTIHGDVFPGHLQRMIAFTRDVPRADSTVRVIAPANLPVSVGVQGEGIRHTVTVAETEARHLITHHGLPALPAEDRMTSALDRDPIVFVSTFASYEDMGRSYWAGTRGAIEATPEIAALAADITRGIDGRRAQAQAISDWVKANVRYVFVGFGVTRVVPHAAGWVVKNRYGDCKDHAALMSALLAAKGIAVEHVLINSGNAFELPEPPTVSAFNHVILYLPEFGVYDDPTAQFATFGTLGHAEYDKPVVRVADEGAVRARTPAMQPEDHVSTRRTRLTVTADGAVSGETEQSGTGLFATSERALAASLQAAGFEKSAEDYLRRAGTPGKGRFDIDSLSGLGHSYAMRVKFTYDEHLGVKPGANLTIPAGPVIQGRPGDFLLGAILPARKLPFTCAAATQVEDIDMTFAAGLPLPQKIDGQRIETKSFVYAADYRIEGRTLKIRRTFVSRVPGQICAPEIAAEVAQPLRNVTASNATRMTFPAQPEPPASGTVEVRRTAVAGQLLDVDFLYALNPDCSSVGVAGVRTVEAPGHGKVTIREGSGYSSFAQDNPRQACNRRRSEGMVVHYQPEPEYLGRDSVTVEVIFSDGEFIRRHYGITVGPKPAPSEVTRAAAAGQRMRIGFIAAIEPDCSLTPVASVRIVEPPKHGEAAVSPDTGFTSFAKENPRSACNTQRINGNAVLYRSEEGYTGKDSVTVEVAYADGREASTRYEIEVR